MGVAEIGTPHVYAPQGVFSLAVRASLLSELIFVSGLTSRDSDGTIVGVGSMAEQTECVLRNLTSVLHAAERSFSDIAKLTVYVTDINEYNAVQAVRSRYFDPPYPAAALVEVSALAHPDLMIEIDAIVA